MLLALACLLLTGYGRLLPPAVALRPVALGEALAPVSNGVPPASSERVSDSDSNSDSGFDLDSDSAQAGKRSTGKRRHSNHAVRISLYMVRDDSLSPSSSSRSPL